MKTGKFKILWKFQKREKLHTLSGSEIKKKLYGEFSEQETFVPKATKKKKKSSSTSEPHAKKHSAQLTMFAAEDKGSSNVAYQNRGRHPKMPWLEPLWQALKQGLRQHVWVVGAIAPVFLLAGIALFLLFRDSPQVVSTGEPIRAQPYGNTKDHREHTAQTRPITTEKQTDRNNESSHIIAVPPKTTPVLGDVTGGVYTVQVCVYDKNEDAAVLVEKLKEKGFQAFVSKATSSKGLARYRVYIGTYAERQEAAENLAAIKTLFEDSFVRKIKL